MLLLFQEQLFYEKRKVNLDNLKEYDEEKIKETESYMNFLIENEYVNNFNYLIIYFQII